MLLSIWLLAGIARGQKIKVLWRGEEVLPPGKIVIYQGKIYLLSRRVMSKLFVYSLKNGKELGTIGREGTGPGELYMVNDFNIWKGEIYFYELYSGFIKVFDMAGKEKARAPLRAKINKTSKRSIMFTKFFISSDTRMILIGKDLKEDLLKCEYHPFIVVHFRKNLPPAVSSFGKVPEAICRKKSEGIHQVWEMDTNFSFYKGKIFYYDMDKFKIYVADEGTGRVEVLVEEELPYFIPLRGDIKFYKFEGGATSVKENFYLPQIRIFPLQGGFWVFIPTKDELHGYTPGLMRKYVYEKGGGVRKTIEIKTSLMPLAYKEGVFVGIDEKEKLVAFVIE